MTDDIREKTRAVFLAAIMALSVIAMTATFSGAAAAQNAVISDGDSEVTELIITDGTDATADDLTEFNNLPDSATNPTIQTINAPHASVLTEEVNNGPGAIDQNEFGAFDDTQTLASVVGVPIQTSTYEDRLGTDNGEDLRKLTFQHHAIGVDASQGDGDLEVTLDYSETVNTGTVVSPENSGLVVAPADAEGLESGNSLAGSAALPAGDGTPGAGSALSEIDDISVENQAGEITIQFNATGDIDNEAFVLRLALTANSPADPGVEATGERSGLLSVDQDGIEHTASMSALDDEVDLSNAEDADTYTMIETGPVAIDVSDRTDIVETLQSEDVNPQFSSQPDNGAFVAYEGSQVTLSSSPAVTGEPDLIEIHEAETNESGYYQLGSKIDEIGTNPGYSVNLDTSSDDIQEAREDGTDEFFLLFDRGDETQQVLLEIRDLDFSADWDESNVFVSEDIEVNVNSEDKIGGELELWIGEVGFGDFTFSDVDHVETAETNGRGEATLSVDPDADLSGTGTYAAVVEHQPSETIIPLGIVNDNTVTVEQDPEQQVNILNPVPPREDNYVRGDIIRVDLEFENTDTATVTFGDRTGEAVGEGGDQNFEMNFTVQNSGQTPGPGDATVFINTFQIGDNRTEANPTSNGYYSQSLDAPDPADGKTYKLDDGEGINHGVQAGPGTTLTRPANYDDSSDEGDLVDVYAPEHDIDGGSTGGAVIAGGITYDLYVTSTDLPHKEEGANPTDRSAVRIQERDGGVSLDLWNAPGSGGSQVEPETYEDIANLQDEERITRADGTLADNDFLIFQAQSPGLEGVIYDALLRNDTLSDTSMYELVNQDARGGDDIISEEFFATELLGLELDEQAEVIQEGPNEPLDSVDPLEIGPSVAQDVIVNESNAGFREYFIPVKLESGTEFNTVSGDTRELQKGLEFAGNFSFRPPEADDQRAEISSRNLAFSDGFEFANAQFEFVDDQTTVNTGGDDILIVPDEPNVTISGTTNIASGTDLLFTVASAAGVEEPLFERYESTVQYQADQPNSWEIVVDEFDNDALEDTEFEIGAGRTRETDQLMRVAGEERAFPGAIAPQSEVDSFSFSDQQVAEEGAQVILIDEVTVDRGGQIGLLVDGELVGSSDPLSPPPAGQQNVSYTNVPVVLQGDAALTEETEVTAVAYSNLVLERRFQNGPVEQTATIEVGEPAPANFQADSLSPETAEVTTPGEDPAELTVSATITNTGELEATQEVALEIGGSAVATQDLTLTGGASEDVEFTVDTSALSDFEPGDYTHLISTEDDETAEGTLTIPEPPEPATFEITSYSPEEATVTEGDEVTAEATIENTGELEGTQTAVFSVDSDAVDDIEQEITLGGGASESVELTFTAPEVDEDVTVTHTLATDDDEASGELTIENEEEQPMNNGTDDDEPADDEGGDNESEDGDDSGPGFGIAAALIALLGAALLAYRRREA